jgi:hypothetical protein
VVMDAEGNANVDIDLGYAVMTMSNERRRQVPQRGAHQPPSNGSSLAVWGLGFPSLREANLQVYVISCLGYALAFSPPLSSSPLALLSLCVCMYVCSYCYVTLLYLL